MNNSLKAPAAHGRLGNETNKLASEAHKFHHPMMKEKICFLQKMTTVCTT